MVGGEAADREAWPQTGPLALDAGGLAHIVATLHWNRLGHQGDHVSLRARREAVTRTRLGWTFVTTRLMGTRQLRRTARLCSLVRRVSSARWNASSG